MNQETRARRTRNATIALSIATAVLAACGRGGPGMAEVREFHLAAGGARIDEGDLFICPGEDVTASWVTVESIHNALLINGRYQPVSIPGPYVEPSVPATTWFRLDATGSAPRSDANMSSRVQTANVLRAGERTTFAGTTVCSTATLTWHASPTFASNRHSNRLRVGRIFNTSGRMIHVGNGVRGQWLRPMEGTLAFENEPLSGPWSIDGVIEGTESCFNSDGHPQGGPWLSFLAEVRC